MTHESEVSGTPPGSFKNLLVESGDKLKICEDVLKKCPIDSDLDHKLTQLKSEVSTAHFEVKNICLRVTKNKKLRAVTFNNQRSYHSADYVSKSREGDDFHDPCPSDEPVDASVNVLPNYRAMPHKQTLPPFKYDKQPTPQFSGWAVDYQLFKIKWSHLEH